MMAGLYEQMALAVAKMVDWQPHWLTMSQLIGDSPIGYTAELHCKWSCCNAFFPMVSDGYSVSLHKITDPFNEHMKQHKESVHAIRQ
jgi:hypothetical protein